jgi:hypothetical protein
MAIDGEAIREVARRTVVLHAPTQHLATFGATNISYYLVTEPSYADPDDARETVVREGRIVVDQPKIITPYYLLSLFDGFAHGREYADHLAEMHGAQSPGLLYSYKNELRDTSIIADPLPVVVGRLQELIQLKDQPLTALIHGVDQLWDVSLMKFIFDLTVSSVGKNARDLAGRGLFEMQGGVPRAAHERIAELFGRVRAGEAPASDLKDELDRWGLWEEYQDRFFDLFRRR